MTFQLLGKYVTKSYVLGSYLPQQDRLLTSLLPDTYHQTSTTHMPLSTLIYKSNYTHIYINNIKNIGESPRLPTPS